MKYFNREFLRFFDQLERNNNKEWFDKNRKTYENEVRDPFVKFVTDLLERLPELDPEIDMLPKEAIFRINRDIRFSKDKTPYNTLIKAAFAKGGKKSSFPGYYLAIGSGRIHIGGGIYNCPTQDQKRIRKHIATNINEFIQLIDDSRFKDSFGTIQGEKLKRIPADLKEVAEKTDIVFNKQFYYMVDHPSEIVTGDNLLDFVLNNYKIMNPMNMFFKKAF